MKCIPFSASLYGSHGCQSDLQILFLEYLGSIRSFVPISFSILNVNVNLFLCLIS
jgi:hypothetical protein